MSHVASLLASAVIPAVCNKLGSVIGDEVTMLCSFKNDLKDLKDTLEYMEAALKDAERRSVTEELVRLWLKRLKNAAYDISYMLDEFQANSEPTSRKVHICRMFSLLNNMTELYAPEDLATEDCSLG
ncbi:putative disease resistance protein At1g50180 [Triticum aestivum]|uniref:putative disease resistance protein At1g50180 n=1 Tax=Triticum aestivum TaxID=4565 RepID=UPI0003D58920|nr:putative disease resistance protein At1g50180 [Triticum aestivum]